MKIILLLGLLCVSMLGIFFFMRSAKKPLIATEGTIIRVVCTTGMIADAVKNIGGQYVQVITLMGPGIDPHSYRATAGDMQRLLSADIIFCNGLHLEGKMVEVFGQLSARKQIIPVAELIAPEKLRATEFAGVYDPHIWHDVLLWKEVVSTIEKMLARQDPAHATYFKEREHNYQQELNSLHEHIMQRAQELPVAQRTLVTAHDAFSYFGARYGFNVIGVQGVSTESHVGVKDIQDLAAFIVHARVRAIFVESSVAHRSIDAVCQAAHAAGHTVIRGPDLFSDALGDVGTAAASYIGMMRHNIDTIVTSLQN